MQGPLDGPRPPRSSLAKIQGGSTRRIRADILDEMSANAYDQGYYLTRFQDIADPWVRRACLNDARERWGKSKHAA